MSQPATQTEAALEEFRQAGAPIEKVPRLFLSRKMTGFNAEVYASWIGRWAANAAANYPMVKGSAGVAFLRNAAQGVPAVVVGIGPSLDDSIADLKRAPRHAVVIATDAALRPLVRHGIHPDIVLNFDARDGQPTMWETIDTSPYVLLANSCASPHALAAWRGAAMFFNMRQDDDEFCSNILPAINPYLGQLPNAGTVGNGAVLLAHLMGCKPILGVGMDLCYRQPDKRTATDKFKGWRYRCKDWKMAGPYFDGAETWEEIENEALYANDERVANATDEEIKGKIYKTDEPLKFYRNSLVSNVGQFDIPLVNCSGGVLADLVKSMPLRQALETLCYKALDPARTAVKFLRQLVPAANLDWTFCPETRIFIPKTEDLRSRLQNPKEVTR